MIERIALVWLSLTLFTGSAKPQEQCTKTLAEGPSILGLRLGMSYQDLATVFGPSIKIKPAKSGEGSVFQSFAEQPAPNTLAGVRALYVRLLDNKAYQIEIFYDEQAGATLEDFTSRLSQEFNVPPGAWTTKHGAAMMKCNGFTLHADVVLNPRIEVTDEIALAAFKEKKRQEKSTTKKKKS